MPRPWEYPTPLADQSAGARYRILPLRTTPTDAHMFRSYVEWADHHLPLRNPMPRTPPSPEPAERPPVVIHGRTIPWTELDAQRLSFILQEDIGAIYIGAPPGNTELDNPPPVGTMGVLARQSSGGISFANRRLGSTRMNCFAPASAFEPRPPIVAPPIMTGEQLSAASALGELPPSVRVDNHHELAAGDVVDCAGLGWGVLTASRDGALYWSGIRSRVVRQIGTMWYAGERPIRWCYPRLPATFLLVPEDRAPRTFTFRGVECAVSWSAENHRWAPAIITPTVEAHERIMRHIPGQEGAKTLHRPFIRTTFSPPQGFARHHPLLELATGSGLNPVLNLEQACVVAMRAAAAYAALAKGRLPAPQDFEKLPMPVPSMAFENADPPHTSDLDILGESMVAVGTAMHQEIEARNTDPFFDRE